MYTISNNYDLQRLKGASVQQICFTKNTISLLFEGDRFITFEGRFCLIDDSGVEKDFSVYPVYNDLGLLKLIEQKIEKVNTNVKRTDLILQFDNEHTVILYGDENYESYIIRIGDDEVRV